MALNKFTQNELDWVKSEYENGRSIEEISVDTGLSRQMIKRMLAETGTIYLTWYKTRNENALLQYLRIKGITSLDDLPRTGEL